MRRCTARRCAAHHRGHSGDPMPGRFGPVPYLILAGAAACNGAPPGPPAGDAVAKDAAATQVTALADAYVKDYLEAFPYQALELGAPEVHPDRLTDHSLPALKKWEDRED